MVQSRRLARCLGYLGSLDLEETRPERAARSANAWKHRNLECENLSFLQISVDQVLPPGGEFVLVPSRRLVVMQTRSSRVVEILDLWYLSFKKSRVTYIDQPQGEGSHTALYRACIHKLPMRILLR